MLEGFRALSDGLKQLFRVAINAKRPGAVQFIFPVTAAEQSNAEHPGAASSQHIPGGITDAPSNRSR